jgi:glycosyltransferase involved in cell wall biosynthesis
MSRPLRILHISTRLILGGSQENTILSCIGAADRGHRVGLAYGPIYGPEGSLLQRALGDGRIETFEVPSLVRRIAPLKDLRAYWQMRRLIQRWRPDVVHTHSSKAGILGRGAAWAEGVPVVVHTIHGLPFHQWQPAVVNALYVLSERWAARRCHAIVSVADAMTRQALERGVGELGQYRTIRSGMEVEPFLASDSSRAAMRARFGFGEGDVVAVTLARLAKLKGHDDLLDALEGQLRSGPLRLLWVGNGWWTKRLKARVAKMGLQGRVTFAGLVQPTEVPAHLAAADLCIHPSYREGLPRAVVQAMLCGKPVVAYDIDGTREVVVDGVTGRLLNPGDRAALEGAVAGLVGDAAARQRMGAAARESVRAPFDWRVMCEQLDALYREIHER